VSERGVSSEEEGEVLAGLVPDGTTSYPIRE